MTDKEIAAYARQVAQRILVRQCGGMDSPETWTDAALTFGCRCHAFYALGGPPGEYAPLGDGQGVIAYNTAMTPPAQSHVLVHEIAHHLLTPLIPSDLFGEYVTRRYDDDPDDVRHRIAKRVEEICFRRTT